MAVTGFWPVFKNLKATLDYADNPDKTTAPEYLDEDLYSALRYAENDDKTDRKMFVGGINCSAQNAYAEMVAVQRRFGLRGKVVGYHGIQGFKEGEVTPEQAFEIGKETARRMWGDRYQVLVTVHLNTDNVHCHFVVNALDRDSAAVAVVDSNLHREHILPSERAFAYKLKMEALSHQGKRTDLTSTQPVAKLRTADVVGEALNESRETVRRFIRLTYLIPEFLEKMDKGEIALSVGVELSFLDESSQREVLEQCAINDCTPSYSQAWRMHKADREGTLTTAVIQTIMSEEKANQKARLKIPMERIRKYFPQSYTAAQIEDAVVKLCERDYRRRTDRER